MKRYRRKVVPVKSNITTTLTDPMYANWRVVTTIPSPSGGLVVFEQEIG